MEDRNEEARRKRFAVASGINGALALALFAVLALAFGLWAGWKVEGSAALRDGRNLVRTMRLLEVYHSDDNLRVYDADSSNGISEDMEEELRDLAGVGDKGRLALTAWDRQEGTPVSFTYTTDHVVAEYRWDRETDTEQWTVCYQFPLYHFEG